MYGFVGTYGKGPVEVLRTEVKDRKDANILFLSDEKQDAHIHVVRKSVKKFEQDKLWYDDEKLFVASEGVVLNLSELCEEYSCQSLSELIVKMYAALGERFIERLNGTFSMALYEKEKDILFLYTSHVAYRPIYYWIHGEQVLFSTDIAWLYTNIKHNGCELKLDMDGAYSLLSYGHMLGDKTLAADVKKVTSGQYVKLQGNACEVITYWDPAAIKESGQSYDQLLEQAEKLFTQAVRRVYEKDNAYGYSHVCTLSGGLDSRSIAMVAHDLGYKDQLFITFCQSGVNDMVIASQISAYIKGEHLTYELDNGLCYGDIKKAVLCNGGLVVPYGFLPTKRVCELVDLCGGGMLHGGEVGDAVFGGSFEAINYENWEFGLKSFSDKVVDRISDTHRSAIQSQYPNGKIFALFNRGINGAENSWIASNSVTETSSAFVDKDFLSFCLSVPTAYLRKSKFYIDWMAKYHPDMCLFDWAKTNARPNASAVTLICKKLIRRIKHKLLGSKVSMNPYDDWYNDTESDLRKVMDQSYAANHALIQNDQLREDCAALYQAGSASEKMQVIALLEAVAAFDFCC